MDSESVKDLVHVVEKLLTALGEVELLGTNEEIQETRNAIFDTQSTVCRVRLKLAELIDVPPIPVPEHYAVPLLGDGLPAVPFVIPNVDRTANSAAEFIEIWEQLAEAGICDGWGGSESQRVYGLWVKEGQPTEAARFVCFHANRPAEPK